MKNAIVSVLIICSALFCGCKPGENPDARDERNPMIQQALALKDAGKIDEAAAAFRAALKKKPKLARADLELARLLHEHYKDYPAAVRHYNAYLFKRPGTQKQAMVETWIEEAFNDYAPGAPAVAKVLQENKDLRNFALKQQKDLRAATQQIQGLEKAVADAKAAAAKAVIEEGMAKTGTSADAVKAEAKTVSEEKGYTVQKGDTLSRISGKVYGTTAKWQQIYDANRDIMKSPNDLQIGQKLKIPAQ